MTLVIPLDTTDCVGCDISPLPVAPCAVDDQKKVVWQKLPLKLRIEHSNMVQGRQVRVRSYLVPKEHHMGGRMNIFFQVNILLNLVGLLLVLPEIVDLEVVDKAGPVHLEALLDSVKGHDLHNSSPKAVGGRCRIHKSLAKDPFVS